jgi:hypothetical protein
LLCPCNGCSEDLSKKTAKLRCSHVNGKHHPDNRPADFAAKNAPILGLLCCGDCGRCVPVSLSGHRCIPSSAPKLAPGVVSSLPRRAKLNFGNVPSYLIVSPPPCSAGPC